MSNSDKLRMADISIPFTELTNSHRGKAFDNSHLK